VVIHSTISTNKSLFSAISVKKTRTMTSITVAAPIPPLTMRTIGITIIPFQMSVPLSCPSSHTQSPKHSTFLCNISTPSPTLTSTTIATRCTLRTSRGPAPATRSQRTSGTMCALLIYTWCKCPKMRRDAHCLLLRCSDSHWG
jgi:hypothetical protein